MSLRPRVEGSCRGSCFPVDLQAVHMKMIETRSSQLKFGNFAMLLNMAAGSAPKYLQCSAPGARCSPWVDSLLHSCAVNMRLPETGQKQPCMQEVIQKPFLPAGRCVV